jgi:2-dehydropantoate 2-reductase
MDGVVNRLKWAVIGGGSIGMLLAASLSRTGVDVSLVTRTGEQSTEINRLGIDVVESPPHAEKAMVSCYSSVQNGRATDVILLAVKQGDIESSIDTIRKWMGPHTILCAFQNGWGHGETISSSYPELPLLMAVTTEGARKNGLREIDHTGKGETWIGLWSDIPSNGQQEQIHQNIKKLINGLNIAGFQTSFTENIKIKMWDKLIINSVINPMTAILGVKNGWLTESPHTLQIMKDIFRECVAVAIAEGVQVDAESLWTTVLYVCERTRENHSSMLQDLLAFRTTEIESINGAIKRLGEKHDISLPYHSILIHMIRAKEQLGRRRMADDTDHSG